MKVTTFSLLFLAFTNVNATIQEVDSVLYNGMASIMKPYRLPTPVQFFFKDIPPENSPFDFCSTSNYRGHVAVYEIKNDTLYVNKIYKSACKIGSETSYQLTPLKQLFGMPENSNGSIAMTFFTGFIEIESYPKINYVF